jgi:hypothetical protein
MGGKLCPTLYQELLMARERKEPLTTVAYEWLRTNINTTVLQREKPLLKWSDPRQNSRGSEMMDALPLGVCLRKTDPRLTRR